MDETTRRETDAQPGEFDDRFTSATGDFSAGGVAVTRAGTDPTPPASMIDIPEPEGSVTLTSSQAPDTQAREEHTGVTTPTPPPVEGSGATQGTWVMRQAQQPRTLFGVGLGTLAFLGGAVAAVWLFLRRRRERNKPINRLRRRAMNLMQEVGKRIPEREDVAARIQEAPVAAPAGGAGTLGLVLALLLLRALRGRSASDVADQATDLAESTNEPRIDLVDRIRQRMAEMDVSSTVERAKDVAQAAKSTAREQSDRMPSTSPKAGLGLGGALGLAALGYLVWRLVRGERQPDNWFADSSIAPNQ